VIGLALSFTCFIRDVESAFLGERDAFCCWLERFGISCRLSYVNLLPYARKEEESKAKVVFEGMSLKVWGMGLLLALCPIVSFF
jgi:hypothetical protein